MGGKAGPDALPAERVLLMDRRVKPADQYARRVLHNQMQDYIDWLLRQPTGWPEDSILERVLRNPGRSKGKLPRGILHEIPPPRLRALHHAFVLQPRMAQHAFIIRYGMHYTDDGRLVTAHDRAAAMGVSVNAWRRLLTAAREQIAETMRRPPGPGTPQAQARRRA